MLIDGGDGASQKKKKEPLLQCFAAGTKIPSASRSGSEFRWENDPQLGSFEQKHL